MKKATYHHRWTFWYTDKIANWDTCDYWERESMEAIEREAKKGEILFSIGVEHCLNELIYAQFVGAENMVLIEPSPFFWPGIRLAWRMNNFPDPKACVVALVGDKTMPATVKADYDDTIVDGFPKCAWDLPETSDMAYRYIHQNLHQTNMISIDDWCEKTKIYPDHLCIDTEGAELLILKGAKKVLTERHPKVWLSLHPGLIVRDYGAKDEDSATKEVMDLMNSCGYAVEFISHDHEWHWYFHAK